MTSVTFPVTAAAFARIDAAEDAYYDQCTAPMYKAAIRLVRTPLPAHPEQASSEAERPCRRTDLLALLAKIEIIHEQELETHEGMPRHPLDVLREDVGRLGAS